MGASSQSIRRSLRGSSQTAIYSHVTEPGSHEPEFRKLWRDTGSLNKSGEFKQWLHIFVLRRATDGVPSIDAHSSLPWVNLMPKPDLENLKAMYHMTKLVQYPAGWEHWNLRISQATIQAKDKNYFGPYWMLLPRPDTGSLAQELVALKRRIHNEMFRDADPWSASMFELRVIESMEPFLIHTPERT